MGFCSSGQIARMLFIPEHSACGAHETEVNAQITDLRFMDRAIIEGIAVFLGSRPGGVRSTGCLGGAADSSGAGLSTLLESSDGSQVCAKAPDPGVLR